MTAELITQIAVVLSIHVALVVSNEVRAPSGDLSVDLIKTTGGWISALIASILAVVAIHYGFSNDLLGHLLGR